jgi:hypothetical protein
MLGIVRSWSVSTLTGREGLLCSPAGCISMGRRTRDVMGGGSTFEYGVCHSGLWSQMCIPRPRFRLTNGKTDTGMAKSFDLVSYRKVGSYVRLTMVAIIM